MARDTSLLTFSIGPVHTFIAQARRVADLWAGSALLSHLIGKAIEIVHGDECEMIFPAVKTGPIPPGLPNRFVCRIPSGKERVMAGKMRNAVIEEWNECVKQAVDILKKRGIYPDEAIWQASGASRQTDKVLDISWSWVPENGDYAAASRAGAAQFAASRMFRPFEQIAEEGEKCAICGERTALPNGRRSDVRTAWETAEKCSEGLEAFFRGDQSRLCLVCATKRLYPLRSNGSEAYFRAFDRFQPKIDEPYFAVVAMDGDNMGRILGWQADRIRGDVENFHIKVSEILTNFASDLRKSGEPALNLDTLKHFMPADFAPASQAPQLIYAGGEDVLFICNPRDALPIAQGIRNKYREMFKEVKALLKDSEDCNRFTISAAILFCHTKHPAGLVFRDVQNLLDRQAKDEAGRDAVAMKLDKRGGYPISVAFKWDDTGSGTDYVRLFNGVVARISDKEMSSSQSFNLPFHNFGRATELSTLEHVFTTKDDWEKWLAEKLSRGIGSSEIAGILAKDVSPFFMTRKTDALRIARFLAKEVE